MLLTGHGMRNVPSGGDRNGLYLNTVACSTLNKACSAKKLERKTLVHVLSFLMRLGACEDPHMCQGTCRTVAEESKRKYDGSERRLSSWGWHNARDAEEEFFISPERK